MPARLLLANSQQTMSLKELAGTVNSLSLALIMTRLHKTIFSNQAMKKIELIVPLLYLILILGCNHQED